MKQDEIIEMARQAGLSNPLWIENDYKIIETLVNLVAAKEEKKWQDQTAIEIHEAVLEEREACAKLADDYATWGGSSFYYWLKKLATEIRARGEKE